MQSDMLLVHELPQDGGEQQQQQHHQHLLLYHRRCQSQNSTTAAEVLLCKLAVAGAIMQRFLAVMSLVTCWPDFDCGCNMCMCAALLIWGLRTCGQGVHAATGVLCAVQVDQATAVDKAPAAMQQNCVHPKSLLGFDWELGVIILQNTAHDDGCMGLTKNTTLAVNKYVCCTHPVTGLHA